MILRLSRPRAAWATAGGLFAAYALTMARDLTFYDSPELALVAHELGVGHPAGQPLHTLLGFAFARLPGLSPHAGLTLMSALFGALCVWPAWSLSERLTSGAGRAATLGRSVALLGVGLSLVAWEPSTRVEVYSLAAFLGLWAVAFAQQARGGRAWAGVGLALGLATSAHLVVAFGAALAVLPRLLAAPRRSPEPQTGASGRAAGAQRGPIARGARALAALAGGLVGLLPYAHVPLASGDPRTFAWGGVRDASTLFAYLSGADYARNQGIDAASWLAHLAELAAWALAHGVLPVALVGLAGFVTLGRRRRGLPWALPLAALSEVGFVAANVVFHPDVPDYRGYFLAPLWMAGAGVAGLAAAGLSRSDRFRAYGAAAALVPALALAVAPGHLTRVRDTPSLAGRLARGALESAPRNAFVVVEADHWVAPLLYVQEVEGRRPDVTVIPHGLASSSWYWAHLFARHPDLRRVPLLGPGGRDGRIRRLTDAHPDRPVLVGTWSLARRLGLRPCGVGWLLWTGGCGEGRPDPAAPSARIRATAPFAGEALEVAARVGEARGEALWRLGHGRAALHALLAGLPASGLAPAPPTPLPARAPPLRGPLPGWERDAALHDPARNLALAALLLDALGRPEDALRYAARARALGLPGAARLGAAIQR